MNATIGTVFVVQYNFVIYKVRLLVEKFRLRNYNNELYLQPSIEKNLEVVEKDQDLQQVIELKL